MLHRIRPAFHQDFSEVIESLRMGLWYMLIQRSQGHLAHHIVESGFRVIQFLSRLNVSLDGLDKTEFLQWIVVRDQFRMSLQECHRFFIDAKADKRMLAKVWKLNVDLLGLGCFEGTHGPKPSEPSDTQVTQPSEEQPKCDTAAYQNAAERCTKRNSSVVDVGASLRNAIDTACTEQDASTTVGSSTQTNSETKCVPLLPGTGYKKGKGHPKRGNPYTKGGKKRR